jgi:hypothetical protein
MPPGGGIRGELASPTGGKSIFNGFPLEIWRTMSEDHLNSSRYSSRSFLLAEFSPRGVFSSRSFLPATEYGERAYLKREDYIP